MIALIQRVTQANVVVDQDKVAEIQQGILVLLGVEKQDNEAIARRLLERTLNYRIFSDAQGRMNNSISDIQGELLIVPQFTLPADTRKGNRPGFSAAAPPALGQALFNYFSEQANAALPTVQTGVFGADMKVSLTNDGPVTFWLQV